MIFEKLRQVVAANSDWPMGMAGNELSITEAAYPVQIELRKGGTVISVASGVMPGDYIRGIEFDYFRIINGSVAQYVGILLSSGTAGSNRINGEVSVISGEVVRSAAGVSFWGGSAAGPVAAKYTHMQLWNPVASTKNLVVNQLSFSAGSATGDFNVRYSGTPLANLYAVPNALSKSLGASVSVAENRVDQLSSVIGTMLGGAFVAAAVTQTFSMTEPIIVRPGTGLMVVNMTVNVYGMAMFQFYETAA